LGSVVVYSQQKREFLSLFFLYSAFAQLLSNINDQEKPEGVSEEEQKALWREAMIKGIMLVDYVMKQYRNDDLPVEAIDAFSCPRCLGRRDREYVQEYFKHYHACLNNLATKVRIVQLSFPLLTGGCREVKGLFVRNVQGYNNLERVMIFKDWVCTDCEQNPESEGFDHPDPWYDGRAHFYIIVAHPNEGTASISNEIEKLVITYGSGFDVGSLLDHILIHESDSNIACKSSEH